MLWRMDRSQSQPAPGWQLSPGGRHFYDPTSGWEPLTLTADAVRLVMIDQFALTPSRLELLPGGYLNQTWRAAADNTSWVVRVSRPGRTLDQVRWEQRAARIWRERVPQVIVAEDIAVANQAPGSPERPVTLFRYCASDPVSDSTTPARHLAMAPVLAALHQAALATSLPQRPGMRSVDEDASDLFGWQRVRAEALARAGGDPATSRAADRIDAELADIAAELEQLRRVGVLDARAQAWNDLNPRNRLYRGGRLVGLVDSDDACVQPLAWEVGKELYGHPDVTPDAFLEEYHRAGGPVCGDVASLSVFGRIGAMSAIMWMTEYGDGVNPTPDAPAKIRELAQSL